MLPNRVVSRDGKFEFDGIVCHIPDEDKLGLQNVLSGELVSNELYPLIWNKDIPFRNIQYFETVTQEDYNGLSEEDKITFGVGVRDLFIANFLGLFDNESLVRKVIDMIEQPVGTIEMDGLNISFYPTKSYKALRFYKFDDSPTPYFAKKIEGNKLILYYCFIDPSHLSYHNFENIIDLDSLIPNFSLQFRGKSDTSFTENLFLADPQLLQLLELDKLNLYIKPFNSASRGGERFIFYSKKLADSLTIWLKQNYKEKGFSHVNPVFRYNKFKPNDHNFSSHYDTPYYSAKDKMVSKKTLIVYLTSGHNPNGVFNTFYQNKPYKHFKSIVTPLMYIFNQEIEHEGNPFVDGDKIFIRTELIYHEPNLKHEPEAARLFNSACYMTKQTIFTPELNAYLNEAFNASTKFKYEGPSFFKPVNLHKSWLGIDFVTNGHDYWFAKILPLKLIAVVTLLDYFNGRFKKDEVFNRYVRTNIINHNPFNPLAFLNSLKSIIDQDALRLALEYHQTGPFIGTCCPGPHDTNNEYFDLTNYLAHHSMAILNNILVNTWDMEISEDKIFFKATGHQNSFHFASCHEYCLKLGGASKKDFFHLPPILYIQSDDGYHLILDIFKNDFVVKSEKINTHSVSTCYNSSSSEDKPYRETWHSDPCGTKDNMDPMEYILNLEDTQGKYDFKNYHSCYSHCPSASSIRDKFDAREKAPNNNSKETPCFDGDEQQESAQQQSILDLFNKYTFVNNKPKEAPTYDEQSTSKPIANFTVWDDSDEESAEEDLSKRKT